MADLKTMLCGRELDTPFVLGSGPCGWDAEALAACAKAGCGAVVTKSITVKGAVNTTRHMISNGNMSLLNNEGGSDMPMTRWRDYEIKRAKDLGVKTLIASVYGYGGLDETLEVANMVQDAGADMIEMNLSCPQMTTHAMGSDVGTNAELCKSFCAAVKRGSKLPMMAKMTPNITDMVPVAKACLEGGADGIAAINTIKSVCNVDLNRKIGMPIVNGKSAISGYSGKAVKPVALRFVQQLRTGIPGVEISGIGGIETWEDAAEFLLLGSTTLQVTTSIMQYGYRIVEDMKNGLEHYMEEQGVDSLMDLIGIANGNIIPAEELDRDYVVYPEFDTEKCIGCGRCYVSCYDGAHQAISWDEENRKPSCDHNKCVGCHLCALVCPVKAIGKGEIVMKPGRKGSPADKAV